MAELIRIEGLSKRYGTKEVLKDISLTINKGTITVIKGVSGSGKSTLLNIIGQLDKYDSGKLYFENELIHNEKQRQNLRANKIGFVFQSYCLIENFSVIDNMKIPFLYSNKKFPNKINDDIEKILSRVGLDGFQHKLIRNLSGGEKQRVAIARAIIRQPELIVADEPTGNLDPDNSHIIFKLMKNYAEEGKSVLVVTHSDTDFEEVDMTYRLNAGELV